jgi:UTP--glucose-1-phosphate uridylyltransferase
MSKITKAIIPVAGWGSRMLPITKAVEKCMLPIGNRPVIDYIVQDVIAAGVTDIYFVVGEQSTQVQAYYGSNQALEDYLVAQGKQDKLPLVTPPSGVEFHYIVQPSGGKYGTAVPVGLVNDYIDEGERVAVIMGDDFLYSAEGVNDIARLIEAAGDEGGSMIGVSVPESEVSRYGVLQLDSEGNYQQIVEKPSVEESPSNLINVSKYVLPKSAIAAAVDIAISPTIGEYLITDVINEYVDAGGSIKVIEASGRYLDAGNPEGWLHANNVVAGQ